MAAVSLYHFGNENLEGALSCLDKAERQFSQLPDKFLGLDIVCFVQQMKLFFEGMSVGQTEFTEQVLAKERPRIVMEES